MAPPPRPPSLVEDLPLPRQLSAPLLPCGAHTSNTQITSPPPRPLGAGLYANMISTSPTRCPVIRAAFLRIPSIRNCKCLPVTPCPSY